MISEPYMEIRNLRTVAVGRPAVDLARWSAGLLAGLLVMTAVVLCWRRLAGALHSPLEPALLLAVAVATAGIAVAVRIAWHGLASASGGSARFDRLLASGLSLAVLGVGVALSLPGSSATGLVAFWFLLGLEECWAWRKGGKGNGEGWKGEVTRNQKSEIRNQKSPVALAELPNDDVTQQLVRSRAVDGSEALSGWLRVGLASGQRTASMHVAFCPSFPRTPTLSVEQLDGPAGRLKTVQLLPYGARFDLKLSHRCEEPATVLIRFAARSESEPELRDER